MWTENLDDDFHLPSLQNEEEELMAKGYKPVRKQISQLQVGEITYCRHSGRYNGVSIGRDEDGYFVMTHRARSESYDSPDKIPAKKLAWIKSTG